MTDFSAMTEPVTAAEVAAYKTQAKAAGTPRYNGGAEIFGGVLAALIIAGMIFGIVAFNTVPAILRFPDEGFSGYTVLSVVTFLFAVLLAVLGVWILRLVAAGGKTWENWLRLTRFATANGLRFSSVSAEPSYPGVIFTQGTSRNALNHLMSTQGRFFDVGNFQYIVGSGRGRRAHNWGFLALQLDRALPHMILDATANNTVFGSNLPSLYNKEQVLHLEGDFDKHFTLYCPKQYERDALYVFTPDLMALLIDEASPFDVEIIDTWLFVYSPKTLSSSDVTAWQRMFAVIDTIGAKAVSQTGRYLDERVADPTANIVAPQGRRLRTRISILAVIAVVLYAALQLARIIIQ